jgi:hypothetical protein
MKQSDFQEFSAMLDAVCGLLSRGQYVPNATNTALWFRSLQAHDIAAVRAAFDAHVRDPNRGRFVPVPADILSFLERDDRPGPDEAWATALGAKEEAVTVVWTEETAKAWAAAQPVMQSGDEIGARMAFKDSYGRLVAEARLRRTPVRWVTSWGWDAKGRHDAIEKAVAVGLLPMSEMQALPAPAATEIPEGIRERLLQLREKILGRMESEDDVIARRESEKRRAAAILAAREMLP